MAGHILATGKDLHPFVRKRLADAQGSFVVKYAVYLFQRQLIDFYFAIAGQAHRQLQVAVLELFVEQKYLRAVALAGVFVFELLQGQTSPFEGLAVDFQMELHLAVDEDAVLLVFFGIEYKYFDFLYRQDLLCLALAGSQL